MSHLPKIDNQRLTLFKVIDDLLPDLVYELTDKEAREVEGR
jgi:hypothetical protein